MIAKSSGGRGLTLVSALTLALALGANAVVFSVVRSVLLRPLAYSEPDRLVMVWETRRGEGADLKMTSLSNFRDYRRRGGSPFETMAASQRPMLLTLGDPGQAEKVTASVVTASFFPTLGVAPRVGRAFLAEEEVPGRARVAVLSDGLWRRRFGASPEVVGSTVALDGERFQIVGIMPADFKSPTGEADLWLPLAMTPGTIDRGQHYLNAVARLREGATIEQAQAAMDALAAALQREHSDTNRDTGVLLVPLASQVVGRARPLLAIAWGAVGLVLTIACANVAGLQLLRTSAREREIAIRIAMGATRVRIARQLLTESVMVALGAGAVGLLAARWGLRFLVDLVREHLARADEVRLDAPVVWLTLALSLGAGLVVGMVPALYAAAPGLASTLQGGGSRSATGGVRQLRFRHGFAVAQIAIALVLVVGAGLLVKSVLRLQQVDPGYRPSGVLVARLSLGRAYDEKPRRVAYLEGLIARLESSPQVEGVGAVTVLPSSPFGIDFDVPYHLPGAEEPSRAAAPKARFRAASPGYFEAMGIPLQSGRPFSARDREGSPLVVIVNRTLARRAWPAGDAVGQRLRFFWADWQTYEVVAVAGDVRSYGPDREPSPELFVPYAQNPYLAMNLVVRTGAGAAFAPTLRALALEQDPGQPLHHVTTMRDLLGASTARARIAATLLVLLGALALLLALAGVYSVVAYSVRQRTRELGIRIALGAQARDIARMVVASGLRLALVGVGLGWLGALFLARGLSGLLFEVAPLDATTFLGAAVLVTGSAILASHLPARRAARTDPLPALSSE